MDQALRAILLKQLLIDQVDPGDLIGFPFQIGVILNVNARHEHLRDGRRFVQITVGYRNNNLSPVHSFHSVNTCCERLPQSRAGL